MRLFAAYTLWRRELAHFFRQPTRIASAAATPVLFWILIGSGLSSSFQLPGGPDNIDYLEYFFPGTVVLLVLFSSIFSTFSIIEDRQAGFLQAVMVSPVRGTAIVAGKVLGGATIAWLQGFALLLLGPLAGLELDWQRLAGGGAILAVLAIALTAFGFALAWLFDSTQGFHAIMNLLLIPMWLLSGAFFPLTGAPVWLEWGMRLNPLTYGVAALRQILYGDLELFAGTMPELQVSLMVLGISTLVALIASVLVIGRKSVVS